MSGELTGIGTKLRRWNSSLGQWVDLGGIRNISGPNMSRGSIDTTVLDTVGGYRTKIMGLRDAGQLQFAMNFSRSGYEQMKDDFESSDPQNYEIFFSQDPEETSLEMEGYVSELPLNIAPDEVISCNTTIVISGQVQLESGSGS